ncbi:MAG: hypothetical protein ACLTM8_00105 [Veillonella parvula]
MVAQIVETHNGEIEVETAVDRGNDVFDPSAKRNSFASLINI